VSAMSVDCLLSVIQSRCQRLKLKWRDVVASSEFLGEFIKVSGWAIALWYACLQTPR